MKITKFLYYLKNTLIMCKEANKLKDRLNCYCRRPSVTIRLRTWYCFIYSILVQFSWMTFDNFCDADKMLQFK